MNPGDGHDCHKNSRKLFRKSLNTRSEKDALLKARYLWIVMKQIYKKYFDNAKAFGRAMELVANFDLAQDGGVEEIFKLFSELDEGDQKSLDLGLKQRDHDFLEEQIKRGLEPQQESQIPNVLNKNSPLLSVLVEKWLEEKERHLKPSSYLSYKNQISLFSDVIREINGADLRITHLTTELIREFHTLLIRMPARRNSPILKSKSFKELSLVNAPKISPKTFHFYINTSIEFMTWLEAQGYVDNTRLKTVLQSSKKNVAKRTTIHRVPFDEEDLKKIFTSKQYLTGNFKKAADYWLPLIALFTGARIGELCQLTLGDIKKIEDVYCFDINEGGDHKSIKNQSGSLRIIPIHKELINLDFIGYVEELRKNNQINLFPFEPKNKRNQYHATQKRLSTFLNKVGIVSTDKASKVFHSFRHTVRTKLVDASIDERVIDSIIGHTSEERSIGNKFYSHSQLIKQKTDAMKKLTYELNLKSIRDWKQSQFCKYELRRGHILLG
jgi:integrase